MNLDQEERIDDYLKYKIKCIKDAVELNDLVFIEDNSRLFSTSDLFKIHYATSMHIDINKTPYEICRAVFKSDYKPDVVIFYDDDDVEDAYEQHYYHKRYQRLVLNLIRMGVQVIMYDGFYNKHEYFTYKKLSYEVVEFDSCFSKSAVKELDDYLLHKRVKLISKYVGRKKNH